MRTRRHPHPARRLGGAVAAVAVATGALIAFAGVATADAPAVTSTYGTVLSSDYGAHTVTVSVGGTWAWATHPKDCNVDRYGVGWQVDWSDPNAPGNAVAKLGPRTIAVGVASTGGLNPQENIVAYAGTDPRCGVFSGSYNSGNWGTLTHTYSIPAGITNDGDLNAWLAGVDGPKPCAVTYDLHRDRTGGLKLVDLIAGGSGHNRDNSVQDNGRTPTGNVCAPIFFGPPPPS